MRLIHIPRQLYFATLALFLLIPCLVISHLLIEDLPWWKLSVNTFRFTGPICGGIVVVGSLGLLRGYKWARAYCILVSFSLTFSIFALAVHEERALWALWGLVLLIFSLIYTEYLNRLFHRPFLHSGIKWYQGAPEKIPSIECDLGKLSKIDETGFFLINPIRPLSEKNLPSQALLEFKGHKVQCHHK